MTNSAFLFAEAIDKLKTTVQQGRSFDAAQVKLVGLDDIRAAAGDEWGTIKERVRTNSLDFLRGCLGLEDIVIPAGDGFLVLYADESTRDLERESAMLQDTLNAFYIGEEGMEKVRSRVKGVSIDAKNMHSVLNFKEGGLGFRRRRRRARCCGAGRAGVRAENWRTSRPPGADMDRGAGSHHDLFRLRRLL